MKTEKSLSRAEVNRRISTLTVNPWKHLSGYIGGCHVNAWATGDRRRISRISIDAIPAKRGTAADAFKLAKALRALTGLTIHWHGGFIGQTMQADGKVFSTAWHSVVTPKLP